jgi:hypothetical protein
VHEPRFGRLSILAFRFVQIKSGLLDRISRDNRLLTTEKVTSEMRHYELKDE